MAHTDVFSTSNDAVQLDDVRKADEYVHVNIFEIQTLCAHHFGGHDDDVDDVDDVDDDCYECVYLAVHEHNIVF